MTALQARVRPRRKIDPPGIPLQFVSLLSMTSSTCESQFRRLAPFAADMVLCTTPCHVPAKIFSDEPGGEALGWTAGVLRFHCVTPPCALLGIAGDGTPNGDGRT